MQRRHVSTLGLAATLAMVGACAKSQTGVLVMAHGGNEAWNQEIEKAVAPLRDDYPVEIAFGMAKASTLLPAVDRLEQRGVQQIAVVRLFISGESFLAPTQRLLETRGRVDYAKDESTDLPGEISRDQQHSTSTLRDLDIAISHRGVGESPLVDQVLLDRVEALSLAPEQESVLLLAHGAGDDAENERWLDMMNRRADLLRESATFRHVRCETLREDWPEQRAEALRRIRSFVEMAGADGGRVIVVPFRIAGFGPYEEVLSGLQYVHDDRGFAPHPNLTDWIRDTAEECLVKR